MKSDNEGYSLHQTYIDNTNGHGIAIYTHSSIDEYVIQINPSKKFKEACLIEKRLRGGDLLLFGSGREYFFLHAGEEILGLTCMHR